MLISVVICTKDRWQDLTAYLPSIISQNYTPLELVIVDSSSDDLTKNFIIDIAKKSQLKILYEKTSPGLAFQRNVGLSLISKESKIVCFIDDDVELLPGYLTKISCFLKFNPPVKGVCGNALNEKQRNLFDKLIRNLFLITDNTSGKLLKSGDVGHIFAPEKDNEVGVLSGANMCFRTELFFKEGLWFDDNLIKYPFMEDQDFCIRASKYGKLYQLKEALFVHHISPRSRPDLKQLFEMYIINTHYLFKKNLLPNGYKYRYYLIRILGKLFQGLSISFKYRTIKPIMGWFAGFVFIMHN